MVEVVLAGRGEVGAAGGHEGDGEGGLGLVAHVARHVEAPAAEPEELPVLLGEALAPEPVHVLVQRFVARWANLSFLKKRIFLGLKCVWHIGKQTNIQKYFCNKSRVFSSMVKGEKLSHVFMFVMQYLKKCINICKNLIDKSVK